MKLKIFYLFLMCFCLIGCIKCPTPVISTNNLTQTDYDYQCLAGDKTFSEIIVCYKTQDKAEKKQNKITNDFLKTK